MKRQPSKKNHTQFQKGYTPWNAGLSGPRKTSSWKLKWETREKIRRLAVVRYPTQASVIEAAVDLISEES